MMAKKIFLSFSIIILLHGCYESKEITKKATLILENASIYTVNKNQPWASAVAIKDGEIIFVGNDSDAKKYSGDQTRIINLNGKMILPGFHDIHVHPVHGGVTYLQCNLSEIRGIDNILSKIKACANNKNENEWILGGGWAVDNFSASRLPDKEMLDEIISNRSI